MSNALFMDDKTQVAVVDEPIPKESVEDTGFAPDESAMESDADTPECAGASESAEAVVDEGICDDLNSHDQARKERGLKLAFEKYKSRVVGCLRKRRQARNWSLTDEDFAEVVQDAFTRLWRKAVNGNLDPAFLAKNLFEWACQSAATLIRDVIRKSNRMPTTALVDSVVNKIASAPTETGHQIGALAVTVGSDEIRRLFEEFVEELPPQQKSVGQAIADNWPEHLSVEKLREVIYEMTGTCPTFGQVKGAQQALFEKFRKCVRNRIVQ
ncbi:MAG: sigma-70 family RNA polymerase sigma factor [Verrucomicrobia bacterium]|nr:sigma-70 family RNA polymerase sigma factor [Verrucomicrobiota bacterium]